MHRPCDSCNGAAEIALVDIIGMGIPLRFMAGIHLAVLHMLICLLAAWNLPATLKCAKQCPRLHGCVIVQAWGEYDRKLLNKSIWFFAERLLKAGGTMICIMQEQAA